MDEEFDYIHKRALDGEALAHVHRRLDSAYEIVHETRERMITVHNLLVEHIERDKEMKPALDELTTLWKGVEANHTDPVCCRHRPCRCLGMGKD